MRTVVSVAQVHAEDRCGGCGSVRVRNEAREGGAIPSSSRSRTHSSEELGQHSNGKTSIAPAAPHDSFLLPTHEGSYQLDAHASSGSARALAAAVLRLAGTPQEQRSAAPFQLASCSAQRNATQRNN